MSVKHFFPDPLVLVASVCGTESGATAGTPAGDAMADASAAVEEQGYV